MSLEIIDVDASDNPSTRESFLPEVVRETTENGQVIWLKSAPEDKTKTTFVPGIPLVE